MCLKQKKYAKQKGKKYIYCYTWNKVCFHLNGEQEQCFSTNCGCPMKNAPPGRQGRECVMSQGLLSGSSFSISDHQSPLQHESHVGCQVQEILIAQNTCQNFLEQHLALVSACFTPTPILVLPEGRNLMVDVFEHMKPGSSRGIIKHWAKSQK